MSSSSVPLLYLAHLTGLALGMGAATAKTLLLLRCRTDNAFIPTFIGVSRVMTRLIVTGLILLVLSGVAWLLIGGVVWTPRFIVKLVLVAAIFAIGPVIDNVVTPQYTRLSPSSGEPASAGFLRTQRRYIALECAATLLFYTVTALWVLR